MAPAVTAYAGPAETAIAPDKGVMWQFCAWWFHHCTDGVLEVGHINAATGTLTKFRQFEIGDEALCDWAAAVNSVPGQSVYIRAATVRQTNEPKGSSDQDFVQAPGVWADLDTPGALERLRTVEMMVRANAICITGSQPHHRAQLWFRAEEPIKDAALVRGLTTRLKNLFMGDPAVVNVSTLMRLPGTIAWPWKKGRTAVEPTLFRMATDNRLPEYPIDMLVAQIPQVAEAHDPAPASEGASEFHLNRVSGLIHKIQTGDEWHNNALKLTAHWVGRGISDSEIVLAAPGLTMPGYTVAQTISDLRKMVQGARAKWGVPNVDHSVSATPETPFQTDVFDPWDSLSPPAFPIHALPGRLQEFVGRRSEVVGCDPCALAWACLSAISAATNGQTRLQMKRQDTWSVPPAIWVALIGASGSKKTPIISTAWNPLERIQGDLLRTHAAAKSQWDSLPKKDRDETSEPTAPIRYITHNATVEKLQEIMSRQDRGMGVLHDELAGLIEGMDRYNNKGGGDRAFYLQAYNGGNFVSDRIGRGITSADNLLLTICGGIQPAKLVQFRDLSDDGFWQRLVPVITSSGTIGLDVPPGPEVADYAGLLAQLASETGKVLMQFSEGAHSVREQVEHDAFHLEQSGMLGPHFSSFCSKLPGLFGRLCLVLTQIEGGFRLSVSHATAEAARTLLMKSAFVHAGRVAENIGGGSEAVRSVAGYILSKRKDRVLASELARDVRACRQAPLADVQKLLSSLVAGGWLNPEKEHAGNAAWLVNPSVHISFANRAAQERQRRIMVRERIHGEEPEDE